MKIKITLIAFFASALVLTSCMKNEVSPGIEQVRTAYAELLKAKAQAETTIAAAQAAYLQAQAAVEQANAAYRQAEAAGVEAQTQAALAELQKNIDLWAVQQAQAEHALQVTLDNYEAALRAAKDTMATNYYNKYVAALTTMRTVQQAIFAQNALIVGLAIDVTNGTTLTHDSLVAALADQNAELDILLAGYDDAQALLGDPAAIKAKITELQNDTTSLQAEINGLLIDQATLAPDWADEQTTANTKSGAYTAAVAAWNTAKSNLADAEADFLADTIPHDSIPTFWADALRAVDSTHTSLVNGAQDTLVSYTLMKNAQDTIALGTSDLDAAIALHTDTLGMINDSIAKYNNDTIAKLAAYEAAVETWVADSASYNTKVAQMDVLTDSLAAQRARKTAGSTETGLDQTIALNAADSTILYWEIGNLAAVTIPADVTDTTTAYSAFILSVATQNTKVDTPVTGFAALKTARTATIAALTAAKTPRLARIAVLTAALPDLISDYRYHQTFIPELVAAYNAALAAKEAVRPDYEAWKAGFYDEYVASLQAIVEAKATAKDAAKTAWDNALAALATAKAPWTAVGVEITSKTAEKAAIVTLLAAYGNADNYNDNYLAAIETSITAKEAQITATEAAIEAAAKTYATKKIDYDNYMIELASLEEELAAAQAQVAFWKALLDEAIANL